MIIWRIFTNFYIKDFLTKFTFDPESKSKIKTFTSFLMHFLLCNPFSALIIAGTVGRFATTAGMFWGITGWVSDLTKTKKKSVKGFVSAGHAFGVIFRQFGRLISGIIGLALSSVILAFIAVFILPFHHLYSIYAGAKKIKCPNISISKIILDNLFTNITGTSLALISIILIILLTGVLNKYIPCTGNSASKDSATYQNDKKDQAMVAIGTMAIFILLIKKQLIV